MTKAEKLEAAAEFARRVLAEALSEDATSVLASDIRSWACELALVEIRRVTGVEAREFNVASGAEVFDYTYWMHREHQKAVAKLNRLLAENGQRFIDAMGT